MSNVVQLQTYSPHGTTVREAEDVVRLLRQELLGSAKPAKLIATYIGVSVSTLYGITSGRTKWPRPSTTLTLLEYFGYRLVLAKI